MKKIFCASLMLIVSIVTSAQNPDADKIIGTWQSEDPDLGLKFEIFASSGKYFGRLLWASGMFESDGKTPRKDFKNPDKALRGRSRQGIVNVTDLTYDDKEYSGGRLYNPDNGSTYRLNAKLKSNDQLEFRGFMGISLLGKTMKFKRIQ